MNNHENCPICKQKLMSDATNINTCALCGMIIDMENMILFIEEGEERYFCLHGCYEKYNDINFTEVKDE